MNSDIRNTAAMIVFGAICLCLGLVGGCLDERASANKKWKADAIEAGVAEYVVDAKTGEVEFRFKQKEAGK